MPMDAVCLGAVMNELSPRLVGARIDKIHQPERDEVILSLRGNLRLLLSASPGGSRLQFTSLGRENPASPPMFCMLLRRHLTNGKILALRQPPMERIVEIDISSADEMGEPTLRTLVLEAMGRGANLLLLDENRRILDCLHRISPDEATKRRLLPGLYYHPPAPQEKLSLLNTGGEERGRLLDAAPPELELDRWLIQTFAGFSPLVCRELVFLAVSGADARLCQLDSAQKERFLSVLDSFQTYISEGRTQPYILLRDGAPFDFSFFPITQYGNLAELRRMESFSALLDYFYGERESRESMRRKSAELTKAVSTARDRIARRLAQQGKELEATYDRDLFRRRGDILTANLHRMSRGMSSLTAEDFYDPENREVEIPLDSLLSPQENAARAYKSYTKAKTAAKILAEQITLGEAELSYLDSVQEELHRAEGERDLEEVRRELLDTGYLSRKKSGSRPKKMSLSGPREFSSSSGFLIQVGRNNRQNDELTLRSSEKGDLWLHAKKIPGAHVLIRSQGKVPDEKTVLEAASLAAYYSKGKDGGLVPVDCTLARFVKKPAGAKPGMVIYTGEKTISARPEEALLKSLSKG